MSVEVLEFKLNELQRLAEERADLKPCTILVYKEKVVISVYEHNSLFTAGGVPFWNKKV